MTETQSALLEQSTSKETLNFTESKQTFNKGLTHITDACFNFFEHITRNIKSHETYANLYEHKENSFLHIKNEILKNNENVQLFLNLFPCRVIKTMGNDLHLVYNEIVNRFLKVSFSKFRRDFLKHLKGETKNITNLKETRYNYFK